MSRAVRGPGRRTMNAMAELLVLWLVSFLVFSAGMLALAWRTLERRNRVSPSRRSPASLSWLWSLSFPARLHRHLARTVAAARGCITGSRAQVGLEDLVGELERHACAVDEQLVVVARLPRPSGRRVLRELASEVREVDALAERIIRTGRAWAGAEPSARGLAPVAERLDALDAAMRDLAALDRATAAPGAEPRSGPRRAHQAIEGRRRLPPVD
jgi:hypothetical protein